MSFAAVLGSSKDFIGRVYVVVHDFIVTHADSASFQHATNTSEFRAGVEQF